MNKIATLFLTATCLVSAFSADAARWKNDIDGSTTEGKLIRMPEIHNNIPNDEYNEIPACKYQFVADVAQYKEADWNNLIGRAKNVTVEEAKRIADADPNITFFFHMKGWQMVLENNHANPPYARVFRKGDAVFFSGTPWWGSAPGFSDGYVKTN